MIKIISVIVLIGVLLNVGIAPVYATPAVYSCSTAYATSIYYQRLLSLNLTGNQRIDIINVAKSQIGYREGDRDTDLSGLNDGTHSYNNYCEYNYWYYGGVHNGGSAYPWCATFVSWCARQANIPTSILKNSSAAGHSSAYFNIPYYSGSSYTPQPGDLFFTNSWSHVGIVESVSGDSFTTIEGNTNSSGSSNGDGVYNRTRYGLSNYYFGVPNYINAETPTYTEKPNKPRNIKSDKKVYKPGEEIVFSWDASRYATDYKIEIWNGNVLLYSNSIGNVTSFTTPLADTGNCAICVSAGNSVGYSENGLYSFVVTKDIPNKPDIIIANKSVCNTGEIITFSWDEVNLATDYWVSIYNGSTNVYNSSIGNSTTFSSPFAYEGTYAFCVYSGNSNGYSQESTYKFYVTNSAPKRPDFYAQKEIYKPNENIKFNWSKIDLATDYWVIIWKGDSQIESFSTNNATEITRSFSDNGNYAILVCSMNSSGRSEYVMHQFSITEKSIISAETHVKNGNYIINVQLYNFTSGHIFIGGYKENRLIDMKKPLFNQEPVTTTFTGDIDKIKVMVWNNLSGLMPLCEAKVIPSSEFILE